MNILDILIVEDEALARQRLQRLISELGYEISGEAQNAADALRLIKANDPAIVLLDIEMPGETGLQLAKKIALLEQPPAIIFTTAYDQYALDAFNAFAIGYLLKPIKKDKLQETLEKAQTINKAQQINIAHSNSDNTPLSTPDIPKHLIARSHRGVALIPIDTVRCLLANSKYISVIGTEGEHLIDGTLKQLEESFSGTFVRIHRNALISIRHIAGLEHTDEGHYRVCLDDVDIRPIVSRRYTRKIKKLLETL